MEICEALDPESRIIAGRLGRESTIRKNNIYVKDFSYLGRPIKDVIYLDTTDLTVPYHQDNCIVLPDFNGDMNDRALYDIIPFLVCKFRPSLSV